MRFVKGRINIWVIIVVFIIGISLFVVYAQSKSNMSVYVGEEPSVIEEISKTEISLVTHKNEKYNFSIGIPKEWKRVVKDGYETYIHSPSAASVQVQTEKYSPAILNVSEASVSAELSDSDYRLSNFSWIDNSSYSVIYGNNTITYMELTYFDRETIVRTVYTVKNTYYEELQDTIVAIIDSFQWIRSKPLPEGTYMHYSEFGNYEFAYPSDWKINSNENTYFAHDESTGSSMSVTAAKSDVSYSDYSKLDYTNYASQSRNNFILQSYSADDNIIYAQASYTANDISMFLIQYLISKNGYEYAITFEIPSDTYSEQTQMIENIINAFRIF